MTEDVSIYDEIPVWDGLPESVRWLDQLRKAELELDAIDDRIARLEEKRARYTDLRREAARKVREQVAAWAGEAAAPEPEKVEPVRQEESPLGGDTRSCPAPTTQTARIVAALYDLREGVLSDLRELVPDRIHAGTLYQLALRYPHLAQRMSYGRYGCGAADLPESLRHLLRDPSHARGWSSEDERASVEIAAAPDPDTIIARVIVAMHDLGKGRRTDVQERIGEELSRKALIDASQYYPHLIEKVSRGTYRAVGELPESLQAVTLPPLEKEGPAPRP